MGIDNSTSFAKRFFKLLITVLYHPPIANNAAMTEYLLSSLESLEAKYPDCCLIIAGDFNKLSIHRLTRQFYITGTDEINKMSKFRVFTVQTTANVTS